MSSTPSNPSRWRLAGAWAAVSLVLITAPAVADSLGTPPFGEVVAALQGEESPYFSDGWQPVGVVEFQILAKGPQLSLGLLPATGGAPVAIWGDAEGVDLLTAFRSERSWMTPDVGSRHLLVIARRETPAGSDVLQIADPPDSASDRLTTLLGSPERASIGWWERTSATARAWTSALPALGLLVAMAGLAVLAHRRRRPRRRKSIVGPPIR